MKIEMLGVHNTETDKARLPCLLVDDVMALDAGGLTSSLTLQRQRAVRTVLLTHHHFDHSKDIIMLCANGPQEMVDLEVFGLPATLDVVYRYLMDGQMYRDYTKWPSKERPRLRLSPVEPLTTVVVGDFDVTPVSVTHSVPSVGFLVSSPGGKSFFYTGDTGPGLGHCWEAISPDLLFIEVTGLDSMREEMTKLRRHLTPSMLVEELNEFRRIRSYLPRVIITHIPTAFEEEVRAELAAAGKQLETELEVGYEGLMIDL